MGNETEQKHMKEAPDMVLIEAYLNGDQTAFAALYERYKRQLYAYLGRMPRQCQIAVGSPVPGHHQGHPHHHHCGRLR